MLFSIKQKEITAAGSLSHLVGLWLYFLVYMLPLHLGGSGHLNPAVTIALAAFGDFDSSLLATYIAAQFAGAITGAIIVWLAYKQHFDETDDKDLKLAVFCTAPAIRNPLYNLTHRDHRNICFGIWCIVNVQIRYRPLGTLDALPVALLVLGIGLIIGRAYRLCYQSCKRPGTTYCSFYFTYKK